MRTWRGDVKQTRQQSVTVDVTAAEGASLTVLPSSVIAVDCVAITYHYR